MLQFPIQYDEPLFRPPSEAKSLIIQVSLGCSWNKCAFCEMYTSKTFKARSQEEIFSDIDAFLPYAKSIRRVFLGDGDPLVLSNRRLLPILNKLNDTFPNLQRVSTYASPNNLNKKSNEDLIELKQAGLSLLYVGIESGDNDVLTAIQKGETYQSTIGGINKSKAVGIDSSVMIINGVGGQLFSKQHAIESAKVLNATQPKYASTLVLTPHKGLSHYKNRFLGEFIELSRKEQFEEMKLFMQHLELEETIFRSDHASNRLVLKGILGKDKSQFLSQIEEAIQDPYGNNIRDWGYTGY